MADINDKKATNKTAGFSEMELSLMKERAREHKVEARVNKSRELGEKDVLAAIGAMSAADQTIARRIHTIVKSAAPGLMPRVWYSMPAYAKEGKVICFFQSASKFKVRYCTLGFQPDAHLDDGDMWPVAFAVTTLTEADEAQIKALVKKAVS